MQPRANITIEIQSTRKDEYDALNELPLSAMDELGANHLEQRLGPVFADLFGASLDSLKVTARHSLVESADV